MVADFRAERQKRRPFPADVPPVITDDELEADNIRSLDWLKREQKLQEAGYRRTKSGLYREGRYPVRILRGQVDVSLRRVIVRTPIHLGDSPHTRDTAFDVSFTSLDGGEPQEICLSLADMEGRERTYRREMTACSVPHARYTTDFHDAINAMAEGAPKESGYDSTGLLLTDQLRFLNPLGPAIAASGPDAGYQVSYFPPMAEALTTVPYGWERGSTAAEAQADFSTVLQLVRLSPNNPAYGFLLLGLTGFSPLSQLSKNGGACGLVTHPSGGKKSASGRVAQQCFALQWGRDDERIALNLRDGATTPWYIQQVTHYLAGLFVMLDDLWKQSDVSDMAVKYGWKVVSLVGRAAATQKPAGKGKWGEGEGGAGKGYVPRGSYLGTAEVVHEPEKHASDLAAFVVLPLVGEEPLDLSVLTPLQTEAAARAMNRATYRYIEWLLTHGAAYADVTGRECFYQAPGAHARCSASYAKIDAGIGAWLDYGVSIGALSAGEAEAMLAEAREALYTAFLAQQELMGKGKDSQHQGNTSVSVFFAAWERLHRKHRHYSTAPSMRDTKTVDGTKTRRPLPPDYLDGDGVAINERGWRWNEQEGVYVEASGALESGVEEQEPGGPVTRKVYGYRFRTILYAEIAKEAREQGELLPGVSEMLAQLKKAGLMRIIGRTHLHGRESETKDCYLFTLPGEDDSGDDNTPGPDDMPPCFDCHKEADRFSIHGVPLCLPCSLAREQKSGQESGQESGQPDQEPARGSGLHVQPISRQRIAGYLDVSTGRGILDSGSTLSGPPDASLARIVSALPADIARVYLTGPRPGGTLAGMQAWAEAGEAALLPLGWQQQARGHWFPSTDAGTLEDEPVLRYHHQETGRQLEIRRFAQWTGDEQETPGEARTLLRTLLALLQETFSPDTFLMGTPAQTGRELWGGSKGLESRLDYPPLTDELQALIRSTSGQGRIELCSPAAATLPALHYLDGVFMYAALTNHLGSGPIIAHDNLNEYAGYTPGRYRIRFTVPDGWRHVGLFMVPTDDSTRNHAEKWFYPARPGETWETWADGAELLAAQQAEARTGQSWNISIIERLLLTPARGGGPLQGWAQKLISLRDSLPGRVAAGQIDTRTAQLLRGALRAILLHTIGSFHRGAHDITRWTLDASKVPLNVPDVRKRGNRFVWTEQEQLDQYSRQFQHPEWSAAIWGRCRSRLLLHRQKNASGELWTGALTLPRESVVAFKTDAIYTTLLPDWLPQEPKTGQFRLKGTISHTVKTPRSDEKLEALHHQMVQPGRER